MGFRDWLDRQDITGEGLLLPDKPRWKGMSRLNPWPCTNAERRKLLGLGRRVKKPDPFALTIPAVRQVAPPPKLPAFRPPTPRLPGG